MKTLDVQALHKAIDHTLEQLKKQSDEMAKVKKSVEAITSLDDALKGKGGDAIRAFYEECHTPFLQFYETFIDEYESALKKIKNALNSLEPNHNGYISQSFLDHELEQGLNAADRTTKHLVSKANATIAKVSHIVDLPDLNDNDFHEQNRKALTDINQTIEKLHTFDREQTSTLKTAESDLDTMQKYITRLEKMYTGPKIEIATYQKGSILKPDEMDALSGNQETAMEVMLDKLDKRSKLEKEISEVTEEDIKISKLKEKLDQTLDDDEYLKIAKEIGYNNLTSEQLEHVKTLEFWKNPLQATVNNLKETIDGAYDGFLAGVDDAEKAVGEFLAPVDEAGKKYLGPVYEHFKGQEIAKYDFSKETGEGLLAIGKFAADLLLDPKQTINSVLEFDYKKAWDSTWDEVKESWDKNFIHGDTYSRSHYVTYFTLNVASLFVSGGGGAVAKSGSVASKVGKVGKTAGKGISKSTVSGIKKGINGAGKVGQAVGKKVVKDAKEVGELIKKGASKLGQIPNPLARELLLASNVPINVLQLQKNGHDLIQQIKKSVDHQKGVKGIGKVSGNQSKDIHEVSKPKKDEPGAKEASKASWNIDVLKNTENFKKGTSSNALNHIFDGEIVKGNAVGFHYEGLPNSKGKIIGHVDPPNKQGVYRAKIEVDGVPKQAKSTFFPKDWTPQQIIDEINEAFNNKVVFKNNRYRGTTESGINIEIIMKKGKIVSAYPVY
ncbi:T7SS effector LXG polymorphic toxin [Bacillus glycinifermentans]|uniref:T7SS effector LXG polymorphic toxin n=1 Tax=Bacillus glycinifermentans TaxID=1664069 RepID=UPI004058A267